MGMETFSVRLSDAAVLQIRGHRYSIDNDAYPGAGSRYRSAFRLICGAELETGAVVCVLEVTLWDEETGELIYSFASRAESPGQALKLLDQFDPCGVSCLEVTCSPIIFQRFAPGPDERARRFRDEAIEFFGG